MPHLAKALAFRRFYPLILLPFLALCTGCQVTLISPYDAETDKQITALQKRSDLLFTKLDTFKIPTPADKDVKEIYDGLRSDLNSLKFRNDIRSANTETQNQIVLLDKLIFEQFLTAHRAAVGLPSEDGGAPPAPDLVINTEPDAAKGKQKAHAFVDTWRSTINHGLSTMLRLELLKKDDAKAK